MALAKLDWREKPWVAYDFIASFLAEQAVPHAASLIQIIHICSPVSLKIERAR